MEGYAFQFLKEEFECFQSCCNNMQIFDDFKTHTSQIVQKFRLLKCNLRNGEGVFVCFGLLMNSFECLSELRNNMRKLDGLKTNTSLSNNAKF